MTKTVLAAIAPFGIVLGILGLDCGSERLSIGKSCSRTSECATPFVCRLDRCRRECNTNRDCATGLSCVLDEQGLGACQLASETVCALDSDCPGSLVCRFGTCTNACAIDRDCPAGSRCLLSADGTMACRDTSGRTCVYHSECEPFGQTCGRDGRCRDECVNDRDCALGTFCCMNDFTCLETREECDGRPMRDAGPSGDGSVGPMPDGGPPPIDGGPGTDGGPGVDGGPMPGTAFDPGAIACAGDVTCAIHETGRTGRVVCWGRNDHGQLGRGTITPFEVTPAPALPLGGAIANAIACSPDACCATIAAPLAEGEVWCWGALPDPDTGVVSDVPTPRRVDSLSDLGTFYPQVPSIGAGTFCVSDLGNGRSACWGDNTYGQLGDGTTMSTGLTAIRGDVLEVRAGEGFVCGVDMSGALLTCVGRNDEGQLGRGTTSPFETSLATMTLGERPDRTPVQPGRAHACALDGSYDVHCWGDGEEGQIGDGAMTDRATPVAMGLRAYDSGLACGGDMCCARPRTSPEILCWGTGPLGSPGMVSSSVPVPITMPTVTETVIPIGIGARHACVQELSSPRRVFCWGANDFGQLGRGFANEGSDTPEPIVDRF